MRTFFTIHAGEFLFGEIVKKQFPEFDLWVPAKDRGIDLLLTDASRQRSLAIQVKMSRDYTASEPKTAFDARQTAVGWFTLSRNKIANSPADIWSFVLVDRDKRAKPVFVNLPPSILLERLVSIHGENIESFNVYLSVLELEGGNRICVESRKMKQPEKERAAKENCMDARFDFSGYLDNWDFIRDGTA